MKPTRREFLVTSAVAAAGVPFVRAQEHEPGVRHEMFEGDLYFVERGLGGRSFDDAREHAIRFRDLEL